MDVELGRPEKEKENEKEECDDLIMYGGSEFEEGWKAAVMTVGGEGKLPVTEGKSQKAERNETTCTEVKDQVESDNMQEKKLAQGKGEAMGTVKERKENDKLRSAVKRKSISETSSERDRKRPRIETELERRRRRREERHRKQEAYRKAERLKRER